MIYCEKEFVGKTFSDFLFRPQYSHTSSRKIGNIASFLGQFRLTLPVISANMDTVTKDAIASKMASYGGIGVIHRNCTPEKQVEMVKKVKSEDKIVGAAVGVTDDFRKRIDLLREAKVDLILFDIAHAHSNNMKEALRGVTADGITLMAGNVATYDGARFLADLGINIIKVGIGPGAACTTRSSTGMGVPQLQAIREVWMACRSYDDMTIIADGGIREDKDIFLSLACGADFVMLGKMIAMTKDAYLQNGNHYLYRGMASAAAQQAAEPGKYVPAPEGIATEIIPFKEFLSGVSHIDDFLPAYSPPDLTPTLEEVCDRIKGHLQSSLSYAGLYSLSELHAEITPHITDYLIPLSEASRQESFVR